MTNRGKHLALIVAALLLAACGTPEERAERYLANAKELLDDGNVVKAKLEARNAAQIDPKNANARYVLALIAEREEEYRPMVGHLIVAVDADPSHVEARTKLGTIYFLGQAYELAREQVTALREIGADTPDAHVLFARMHFKDEERDAAVAELEKALAKDDKHIEAHLLMALSEAGEEPDAGLDYIERVLVQLGPEQGKPLRQLRIALLNNLGRSDEVVSEYRSLIEDFPEEKKLPFELARFFVGSGRVDDAEQVLRELVERDPEDTERRIGFAGFMANVKGVEAAESALKEFVTDLPDDMRLKMALARVYEQTERREEARQLYEEIGAAEPTSEDGLIARNKLVSLDVLNQDIESARRRVAAILEDVPDEANALLIRAGIAYADQEFDDAVADLRIVIRKKPESQRALLLLARTYVRQNDRVLAADTYRRLLEVNPNHPEGNREFVQVLAANGDLEQAEELLSRQVEAAPENGDALARLADIRIQLGDIDAAETAARKMLEIEEMKGIAHLFLGRVAQERGNREAAITQYRTAVELRPTDGIALESLVRNWFADGKNREAIKFLEQHVDKYPEQYGARFLLGGAYSRVGETAKAEQLFEQILAARPQSPLVYGALAQLKEDRDARIPIFKRGLAEVPADDRLVMWLASEYERENEMDEAIGVYESALEAGNRSGVVINNLAAMLLDYRDDPASYQRALELANNFERSTNPAFLDTLGWAHYRNGDYPRAVRYLEQAVARDNRVPVLHYHLGMAQLAADNPVGAKQSLQQAIRLATADFTGIEEARATLEKLESGAG